MKKKYIFPLLALCFTGNAFSQTLSQAQKWFTEGKFAEAKPVFEKLVRQAPSNANYNFWYGACCYETGELSKAVPYLEKSAERKVINGFLYLSKPIMICTASTKPSRIWRITSTGWNGKNGTLRKLKP